MVRKKVINMSNVLIIFRNDLKQLCANVVSVMLAIGLVILPSVFAWYNLLACWDVFDNTGNLTVAVANNDEGYESELIPVKINVGDMVISQLRANHEIGWHFTDADDAVDGAASGRYYAAVVIPKDFSYNMLRFYTGDAKRAEITYYDNEKINAIAPRITAIGADAVSEKVNTAFAQSISEIMLSIAKSLSKYSDDVNMQGQVAVLAGHVDAMGDDIERVSSVVGLYAGTLNSAQGLLDDSADLIYESENEAYEMMSAAQDSLNAVISLSQTLSQVQSNLESALNQAETDFNLLRQVFNSSGLAGLIPSTEMNKINQSIDNAQNAINDVQTDYDSNIKPALDELVGDAQALDVDTSAALASMRAARGAVAESVNSAQGILGSAIEQINFAMDGLDSSATQMHNLADSISAALTAGNPEELANLFDSDAQALSQALSAPVGINRIAVYPSDNFGSSMAPFYTAIAMFIGSLFILIAIKPTISERVRRQLDNPKPRQIFLGHYCCIACISLAQTTLMGLGNLWFLQVQAANPFLMLLSMWFAGIVFSFLIYSLVVAFANLGKAICVVILILQITGAGGTYPVQILPGFVGALSPFLPATHVIDAMRSAMFGMYGFDYWVQMAEVALFLIPAALIGFVFRKPFVRFMQWYLDKIEATEIIN